MTKSEYKKHIEQKLIAEYGILISGEPLSKALGFKSIAAFRKAIERGTIELPIMTFKNRKGKYAVSSDVAEWITNNRFDSLEKNK
ncbi:hypothetical protein [Marinicella meishanensis]|uniref:hypothetical protein n=1 Tax=Marinicella meishanensis TaxID=2873263 RepID=UPI001CBEE60A|nr:hypothetical protein [Marinicella sp. NBU2979]